VRLAAWAVLALAVMVACTTAASAPPPSARIVGSRPAAITGRPWIVRLVVRRSTATPVVFARLGRRIRRAAVRRQSPGVFRVSIGFPAAGRWRLTARIGRDAIVLGRIDVAPAELLLDQPAQALALADGSFLVAERGSRDRILRVGADGSASVWLPGIDEPFGLAQGRGGTVLVSSPSGIVRVPGRQRASTASAGPVVELPNGAIVYADANDAARIEAGGAVHQFGLGLETPHGLAVTPDGDVVIADSGHNRLLRLDPRGGGAVVIATGLALPFGIAAEGDGGLLVAEYSAGRLTRIAPTGARQTVATGLRRPYAIARTPDGSVYVVEPGELGRPSGRIARVTPDAGVTRLRLRLRS
jgi:hypothetical protein